MEVEDPKSNFYVLSPSEFKINDSVHNKPKSIIAPRMDSPCMHYSETLLANNEIAPMIFDHLPGK